MVFEEMLAPLAKLDIASVYGTEGQEFESLTVHQKARLQKCRRAFWCTKKKVPIIYRHLLLSSVCVWLHYGLLG